MVGFDFQDVYDIAVAEAQPGDILVEVGVAYGKSLAYLARKVIDAGKADVSIVGIDPWHDVWGFWDDLSILVEKAQGSAYLAFLNEMQAHAPEELARAQVWREESVPGAQRMALSLIAEPERNVSFVFVDAVHDYEHAKEDIAAWLPLIRKGGIIAGHDHTPSWPGVEKAVTEAFGPPGVGYEVRGSSWFKRL